uniref:Uncharacterized protein n=1 Tax=Anguilla anguilla TaxID=7936 RepID=A0A0E9P5J0_ANGAN
MEGWWNATGRFEIPGRAYCLTLISAC